MQVFLFTLLDLSYLSHGYVILFPTFTNWKDIYSFKNSCLYLSITFITSSLSIIKELQESKCQQDCVLKKLKIREKRLRNVEEDNKRLQEELQGTARDSETVVRGKDELEAELKQAKTQVYYINLQLTDLDNLIVVTSEFHVLKVLMDFIFRTKSNELIKGIKE